MCGPSADGDHATFTEGRRERPASLRPAEARTAFERTTRYHLEISGDEFLQASDPLHAPASATRNRTAYGVRIADDG
jgi:hypothetical protein